MIVSNSSALPKRFQILILENSTNCKWVMLAAICKKACIVIENDIGIGNRK